MRSRHRFCIVSHQVTESQYNADSCKAGKHSHVGWSEVNEMHNEGSIQPIGVDPAIAKAEGEPDYVFEWLIPGRVLRFKRHIPIRGLSSKFGAYLAAAFKRRKPWAVVMVSQMREELVTALTHSAEKPSLDQYDGTFV